MAIRSSRILILLSVLGLLASCANIVPPSGGKKDITAPVLRSVSPADSQLNTRVKRIEMKFDEFITVSDVTKELHISPALDIAPTMTGSGKTVIIKIQDSLLQDQTTYTISFGQAIKDLHEGNPYLGKPYLFSTGSWFDSLQIRGHVTDAQSGITDSSGTVTILLYSASLPFNIVTRQKPAYVTTTDRSGNFRFIGLPAKQFRIFALKETTGNLQFDNNDEYIAFLDTTILASVDTGNLEFSIFRESLPDSLATQPQAPTATAGTSSRRANRPATAQAPQLDTKNFIYQVRTDTGDTRKRTAEINVPMSIYLSRPVAKVNEQRLSLRSDSAGVEIDNSFTLHITDSTRMQLQLVTAWKPNTVYTLRLLKGFATDTSGVDALPSKYIFRSKQEEDYGKMEIHVPGRYYGAQFLLQVKRETDSVYLAPIKDTIVSLRYLNPGNYRISIIKDSNGDGEWTTGDLDKRRHPEQVIPHMQTVMMKAGWEHVVDMK